MPPPVRPLSLSVLHPVLFLLLLFPPIILYFSTSSCLCHVSPTHILSLSFICILSSFHPAGWLTSILCCFGALLWARQTLCGSLQPHISSPVPVHWLCAWIRDRGKVGVGRLNKEKERDGEEEEDKYKEKHLHKNILIVRSLMKTMMEWIRICLND